MRASLVALTVLAPACVLDTKITGNPEDDDATTGATTGADEQTTAVTTGQDLTSSGGPSTGATHDTGDVTNATDTGDVTFTSATDTDAMDTDETAGDACESLYDSYESVLAVENDGTWSEAIDETCTVTTLVPLEQGFDVHVDCPEHGVLHGDLRIGILSGPMPAVPQVGDVLDVYYQPYVDDFIDTPHPEMLFLHSEGELMYAAANGFFLDPNDAAVAKAHYAPLTVDIEPGPCPLVDNPNTGEGDGFICARQALALVHFGFGDDPPLVLGMGMSGEITAGAATYATLVQSANWGEDCVDVDLEWFGLAIARKP